MGEKANVGIKSSQVFKRAFEIYRGSIFRLLGMALVLLLPGYILDAALPGLSPLGLLFATLGLAWLSGAVVQLVVDESTDSVEGKPVGKLLGSVWPRLWSLFLLNLVLSIAISFGLVLLIVPGVILELMWFVAIPVFVIERLRVFESMSRSSDLTSGSRLRILPVALAILLIEAALLGLGLVLSPDVSLVVALVTSVIAYPLFAVLATVVYLRLRDSRELSFDPAG